MNYRHSYHAGNFADVLKHALLLQLVRGLQKKEKGFLYLDTHAGRGAYDLHEAAQGDTRERKPEHPDGIGRLAGRRDLPPALAEYVELVQQFDQRQGGASGPLRHYPGSPWIVKLLAREQDRMLLCEKHPEECEMLRIYFTRERGVIMHQEDGYLAPKAQLPPKEKRALVLIDPPFEDKDEFARLAGVIADTIKRMPSAVVAVWYPFTERARLTAFFKTLCQLPLPPTLVAELLIAGEESALKMKGCGLLILNPPWQFEQSVRADIAYLGRALAQEPGATARMVWLVPEAR